MPTALIHINAIRHNIQLIQKIVNHSRIIAVVKGNAYGHGLLEIACNINDLVNYFGVARINEAILLRNNKINNSILLLGGFLEIDELYLIIKYSIDVVIHCFEQIQILENIKLQKTIKVWIKIDTGMHRLGFHPDDAVKAYQILLRCHNIQKPINIISHFSSSNIPNQSKIVDKQLTLFKEFIKDKSCNKTIAASAGILFWPLSYFDYVRPGIMMYGVSPQKDKIGKDFGLLPVMTLKSKIIAIRKHKKGESVGYNCNWISNCDTYIGIIAIGYGDGYPRNISDNTPVLINGRKVFIIGKVCMDMIIVNLGINSQDKVGDEVILWGQVFPIEIASQYIGTSYYELLTHLNARVVRKLIK